MRIAVYDPITGSILRIVNCPDFAATDQTRPGEAFLQVEYEVNDTTHHIVNGCPVPK